MTNGACHTNRLLGILLRTVPTMMTKEDVAMWVEKKNWYVIKICKDKKIYKFSKN